ncbi:hypothetical protein [Helicobacter sp. MIT 01-3238]|nr:hypothetical protein [Helicobacter sp. MIT 01-3238]
MESQHFQMRSKTRRSRSFFRKQGEAEVSLENKRSEVSQANFANCHT